MTGPAERAQLLDEAVAAGAGQARACEVLGIPERTVQRWP